MIHVPNVSGSCHMVILETNKLLCGTYINFLSLADSNATLFGKLGDIQA